MDKQKQKNLAMVQCQPQVQVLATSEGAYVAARALVTYLIPGCVGRGVSLGSESSSRSGGAGGVWKSGNLEILVPKKNREPERRNLSQARGARGAARPPPECLGGWKPPKNSKGSRGWQPPSKNNLINPEPDFGTRMCREPVVNVIIVHLS